MLVKKQKSEPDREQQTGFKLRKEYVKAVYFHPAYLTYMQCVRKHLTGGFLCAVLGLSGILCSLLIPEYSGIKRRGKPLLGAEESRHFLP